LNNGLGNIIKSILNSTDPNTAAMKLMDTKFENNPMWAQAKKMASSGNAKEKAVNMFKERGVDIEAIISQTMNELDNLK
jgi:hypothetical protein